jgi:hypothetical protein
MKITTTTIPDNPHTPDTAVQIYAMDLNDYLQSSANAAQVTRNTVDAHTKKIAILEDVVLKLLARIEELEKELNTHKPEEIWVDYLTQ